MTYANGRILRHLFSKGALAVLFLASVSTSFPAADEVPFPSGFRDWTAVNAMIVTKDSPIFAQLGGTHLVYVNTKGSQTLKQGGPFPYPDGTVFADDVHQISIVDGSYTEGARKAVTVMVKNSKKYPLTGGWGFQAWAAGDPSKPLIPDAAHAIQACFACHTPQKAQDYTFSTYIP
jgi:hypothetical protein